MEIGEISFGGVHELFHGIVDLSIHTDGGELQVAKGIAISKELRDILSRHFDDLFGAFKSKTMNKSQIFLLL
jgi:hypothetical protein